MVHITSVILNALIKVSNIFARYLAWD